MIEYLLLAKLLLENSVNLSSFCIIIIIRRILFYRNVEGRFYCNLISSFFLFISYNLLFSYVYIYIFIM